MEIDMVDKARCLALAEAIEKGTIENVGFNMGRFVDRNSPTCDDVSGRDCRTTACIAGTAVALFDGVERMNEILDWSTERAEDPENNNFFRRGKELLSLDRKQALDLFLTHTLSSVEPRHAVDALRNLADTGVAAFDLYENDRWRASSGDDQYGLLIGEVGDNFDLDTSVVSIIDKTNRKSGVQLDPVAARMVSEAAELLEEHGDHLLGDL